MTENNIAWLAGLVTTMISAAIWFVVMVTRDYSPVERRARRAAVIASVTASAAIWGATVTIYSFSELAGNFLIFPSIVLTAVAVWHASRITYRKMGGGESQGNCTQESGAGGYHLGQIKSRLESER